MSDFHFIAVLTYGKEKHGNQSDFKLGQGAGADVLLSLLRPHAQEFVARRLSYRYIHIDLSRVSTHKNYIVLRVTTEEKAQVETVCRRQGRYTWVYLWEADSCRWLEFPCAPQARYTDPTSYGGDCPKFPPTHAAFFTPSRLNEEAEKQVASGQVTFTQSGDWWWVAGDTYPHRETLKNADAKWSKSRREWYYKGAALPAAIQTLGKPAEPESVMPVSGNDAESPVPTAEVSATETPSPAEVVPVVEPMPENIRLAIQRVKDAPKIASSAYVPRPAAASISHEFVGELTGSIAGTVHCFGYAVDQGVCVYVNFGGPRMAVEAIRAKFSKGEIVNCSAYDAPSVELTAGERNTGRYTAFMQNISEARYTSVILLHEQVVTPNYGGKSRTCILRTDEAQGIAMLKHHITQLVSVPVFDSWSNFLWDAGELACLVSRPIRAGGVDLWTVDLDADAWTRLICGGLEEGVISLPT